MSSIQDDRRSIYGEVRDIISQSGEDAKVEVNQRALIDKVCHNLLELAKSLTIEILIDSSSIRYAGCCL